MPLKIFRQVALEGVKIDKVQKGHEIQPTISRKLANGFLQKFLWGKGMRMLTSMQNFRKINSED